jgi:ATP-dependent DNA helicase RecQ
MIFSDRTLSEIAAQKPTDLDELATVPGVGASKLERYGEDVLDVLATCGRG